MTYKEIMKSADNKVVKQRVKAIYPHITVSGTVDKPYYNIDWYDIEKQTMYRGFSSYNLELVCKWLEEEFEVVEVDIDDLINRQKAEIERLNNLKRFEKFIDERIHTDKVRGLSWEFRTKEDRDKAFEKELEKLFDIATARAEAIKEFAERLKAKCEYFIITEGVIDNLVKEMVGED